MYKEGEKLEGPGKEATNTPELVNYSEEGKVLNALKDARV